jgi:aspartyl-tRNA(Asn)/glutamyl-tRNA(Gln) amidotransferase subunit A
MAAAMAECDILLTASYPKEAPPIAAISKWLSFNVPYFTMPANITGHPALSLCCGFTPAGMPLSIQLIGRPFEEATVLRVGHGYEQATPWRARRPAL